MQRKSILFPVEVVQTMELLADARNVDASSLYREAVREFLRDQIMKGKKSDTAVDRRVVPADDGAR